MYNEIIRSQVIRVVRYLSLMRKATLLCFVSNNYTVYLSGYRYKDWNLIIRSFHLSLQRRLTWRAIQFQTFVTTHLS